MDGRPATPEESNSPRGIKHGAIAPMTPSHAGVLRHGVSSTHHLRGILRRSSVTLAAHERGSSWPTFVDQFEQFTDMLCAAAQYGITPGREQEYMALRHWFTEHYYEHAHRIRPYLDSSQPNAEPTGEAGAATSRTMDRFEAIFLPRTLAEVLNHDDGNLISLVSQVSSAVYSVQP